MYECALSVSVSLSFACFDLTCWICHSSEVLGSNCTKFSGNAHNHNNYYVIGPFLHGLICTLMGGGSVLNWVRSENGPCKFLAVQKRADKVLRNKITFYNL